MGDEISFKGCQLAGEYKEWPKGKSQLALEPKMDGYRLSAVINRGRVSFHCRDEKPVPWGDNLEHIADELLAMGFGDCMVDGEIMASNFNATGMVRRKARSNIELNQIQDAIKFHAFDMVDLKILEWRNMGGKKARLVEPTPFEERRAQLAAKFIGVSTFAVKLTPMFIVESQEELLSVLRRLLEEGHEGGMAKHLDAPYVMDRHESWGKLKPTKTVEMRVVGAVEGTGKYVGMMGALTCVDADGNEVSVGSGFVDKERAELWQDRPGLVGKIIEVRMQDAASFKATARHPVFVRMRPDRTAL